MTVRDNWEVLYNYPLQYEGIKRKYMLRLRVKRLIMFSKGSTCNTQEVLGGEIEL